MLLPKEKHKLFFGLIVDIESSARILPSYKIKWFTKKENLFLPPQLFYFGALRNGSHSWDSEHIIIEYLKVI